jgi:hypothetical protein
LYKLHGSVDWESNGSQVTKSHLPARPLIVYPRLSKFESSYDQPFIEIMSRFQLSLREPNTGLIVVGCGFNDHHIVQPIMSAIRSNVGLKAAIIDPCLKDCKKESVATIKSLIQEGDWRLTLVPNSKKSSQHFLISSKKPKRNYIEHDSEVRVPRHDFFTPCLPI